MKIFIDTANLEQIREINSLGILDGVTTNPTLLSREGNEPHEQIKKILKIVKGSVSVEAVSSDSNGMVAEGKEWAKLGKNIAIKIPMTAEGLKAVKILSGEKIDTNVTLVFSANQAILAAKAGARFISPFVGRLDDIGHSGMDIVADILDIIENYRFKSEVIVASIRHPQHVVEAARMGAHIATIPFKVLQKMIAHPLTDIGIKRFLEDWKKLTE